MNSDLRIVSEQVQANVPVTVFNVSGWLDAQGEGQLLETARLAHDEGARYLLIDQRRHARPAEGLPDLHAQGGPAQGGPPQAVQRAAADL